jgi:TM2 domain-containing membrane protein YozV
MKSKTTAGLLALLLGGIGAHKFYLNRPGQGILYLIFVWTWIPLLLGLIEGIVYLTMSDDAFNAKYNRAQVVAAAQPMIVNVTNTATASGSGGSVATEIRELKALVESGDLTEEEFQAQKTRLLKG